MVYAHDLWQEKDQEKRVTPVMYLADAVTTLARLEVEEARKLKQAELEASYSANYTS